MDKLSKPLLVFDGDCGFCRVWIERWRGLTGDEVDYAPSQEAGPRFPEIPPKDFAAAVQLIEPGGRRSQGAEAVFRSLAVVPGNAWMLNAYRRVPGVRPVSEAFYGLVARNRRAFSILTRLLWGRDLSPPSYETSRWLFLRVLGLIYLAAFVSFGVQAAGLIGSNGILPAKDFLHAVAERFGTSRYWLVPSLAWLDSSDAFLRLLCWGGAGASLLLVAGVAQLPVLLGLWVLYLSLASVGGDFMAFQWDNLLLETGLLAVFLAPRGRASTKGLWLLRWLLFRLMLESGLVKLLSGDPNWRNLSALDFHYFTQPLPTALAWYAQQLPGWFQRLSAAVMFAIELGAPLLIFLPRRPKLAAAAAFLFLQLLIAATGNYCFFNLLAAALCLPLVDDSTWRRWLPASALKRLEQGASAAVPLWRSKLAAAAAAVIVAVTAPSLAALVLPRRIIPGALLRLAGELEPLRSFNGYGLFAVMTTDRLEISVEGSDDGREWKEYVFKWKPGPLNRRPAWAAPHQPRLDWQMWFAALGTFRQNPWFINFMVRLLQGSPEVLALLQTNPFPGKPPQQVRALGYDYAFTTFAQRRKDGTWWTRVIKTAYCPVMALSGG